MCCWNCYVIPQIKRLFLINNSTRSDSNKLQLSLLPTFLENICKCATYFTKFGIWAPFFGVAWSLPQIRVG